MSEATAANMADLGDDSGYRVLRVHGKGGKVVNVPLAPATCAALDAWINRAELEDGPVLRPVDKGGRIGAGPVNRRSVAKRVKWIAKRAGIAKRISPHSLRHTAVTLALDSGVSLRYVQDFARHADPRTTRRYDRRRHSLNNPAGPAVIAKVLD
ncbi:MAG: tyrosine-type recombinase/integrase [Armatimonadetes bacterium]|nr:tyrosine-type recombinase/integrase [Armatimonadota bacterium]